MFFRREKIEKNGISRVLLRPLNRLIGLYPTIPPQDRAYESNISRLVPKES